VPGAIGIFSNADKTYLHQAYRKLDHKTLRHDFLTLLAPGGYVVRKDWQSDENVVATW
jgi:hypothetical protein